MNSAALAHTAYAKATAITPSPRDTEYRAFASITRKLSENLPVTRSNFREVAEAVYQNQRLWGLLATDVADGGNPLPDELRAQIFGLAEFTRQHTGKVLQNGASTEVLVEINTAIMRGLRASHKLEAG
ncbi:MAG: flagellar biosynthesis regulator FlaF [Pseudomonadota bacterium]